MTDFHPHLSDAEILERLRRFANTLLKSAFRGESWDGGDIQDLGQQLELVNAKPGGFKLSEDQGKAEGWEHFDEGDPVYYIHPRLER
jgi:hypothetical protein